MATSGKASTDRKTSLINLDKLGDISSILRNLIKIDTEERIERSHAKIRQYDVKKREMNQRYDRLKADIASGRMERDVRKGLAKISSEDGLMEAPTAEKRKSRFARSRTIDAAAIDELENSLSETTSSSRRLTSRCIDESKSLDTTTSGIDAGGRSRDSSTDNDEYSVLESDDNDSEEKIHDRELDAIDEGFEAGQYRSRTTAGGNKQQRSSKGTIGSSKARKDTTFTVLPAQDAEVDAQFNFTCVMLRSDICNAILNDRTQKPLTKGSMIIKAPPPSETAANTTALLKAAKHAAESAKVVWKQPTIVVVQKLSMKIKPPVLEEQTRSFTIANKFSAFNRNVHANIMLTDKRPLAASASAAIGPKTTVFVVVGSRRSSVEAAPSLKKPPTSDPSPSLKKKLSSRFSEVAGAITARLKAEEKKTTCLPVLELPKDPSAVNPTTGIPRPKALALKEPKLLDKPKKQFIEPETFLVQKKRPVPKEPGTTGAVSKVTTTTVDAIVGTTCCGNGSSRFDVFRIVLRNVQQAPRQRTTCSSKPTDFRLAVQQRRESRENINPFGVSLKRVDRRNNMPQLVDVKPVRTPVEKFIPKWRQKTLESKALSDH